MLVYTHPQLLSVNTALKSADISIQINDMINISDYFTYAKLIKNNQYQIKQNTKV